MTEYIKLEGNEHLIGKRARFKNNLSGYCSHLWLKEGTIIQFKGLEHVGLSLKFDTPAIRHKGDTMPMNSCYMTPDSFELLESLNKAVVYKKPRYKLLAYGDIIKESDEYYNPLRDKWLPVEKHFINDAWDSDNSKPVRRKVE